MSKLRKRIVQFLSLLIAFNLGLLVLLLPFSPKKEVSIPFLTRPEAEITVAIRGEPEVIRETGEEVIYFITYRNPSEVKAYDVSITLNYDSHIQFVSSDIKPDKGTNNKWSIGEVDPKEKREYKVVVKSARFLGKVDKLKTTAKIDCSKNKEVWTLRNIQFSTEIYLDLAIFSLLVLFLIKNLVAFRLPFFKEKTFLVVLLFFLWLGVTLVLGIVRNLVVLQTGVVFFLRYLELFFVFWVAIFEGGSKISIRTITCFLFLSFALLALYANYKTTFGDAVFIGFFENHVKSGTFLMEVLILLFAFWLFSPDLSIQYLSAILFWILMRPFLTTMARSSYLSLFLGVTAITVLKSYRLLTVVWPVSFGVYLLSPLSTKGRINTIVSDLKTYGEALLRKIPIKTVQEIDKLDIGGEVAVETKVYQPISLPVVTPTPVPASEVPGPSLEPVSEFTPTPTPAPPPLIIEIEAANAGFATRMQVWPKVFRQSLRSPFFGFGLSHLETIVDNYYLRIFVDAGIFAVLLFLGFLYFAFYKSLYVFKKLPASYEKALSAGFFGMVVAVSVVCFFYDFFMVLKGALLFWVLFGMMLSIEKNCLEGAL